MSLNTMPSAGAKIDQFYLCRCVSCYGYDHGYAHSCALAPVDIGSTQVPTSFPVVCMELTSISHTNVGFQTSFSGSWDSSGTHGPKLYPARLLHVAFVSDVSMCWLACLTALARHMCRLHIFLWVGACALTKGLALA